MLWLSNFSLRSLTQGSNCPTLTYRRTVPDLYSRHPSAIDLRLVSSMVISINDSVIIIILDMCEQMFQSNVIHTIQDNRSFMIQC